MRPELFNLPFINVSIKSYGAMMVLGFLAALWLGRRLCLKLKENPIHVTNFAAYALLAGVIGARAMHVMHNWSDTYRDNPIQIIAIWSGGLEFLGGLALATLVMLVYFKSKKLPILKFLDILAPAAMLGLAFGRIGCLLNGCCYGAPCQLPWAIQFPAVNAHSHPGPGCEKVTNLQYSYPYDYQLHPDHDHRPDVPALFELPEDYYLPGFYRSLPHDSDNYDPDNNWVLSLDDVPDDQKHNYYREPKPVSQLTEQQLQDLENNLHPMLPIHPSQAYSILNALMLALILTLLHKWRRYDGFIIACMLVLYGVTRFGLEMIRVEPAEWFGLSISQNMGLVSALIGLALLIILPRYHRPIRP
jgi:phosphatidylglycerol:prolipoprotein diacylglycerol transferase